MLLAALAAILPLRAATVPYRAWQFHKLDTAYVAGAMKLAAKYDVNTVVFSHGMIGATSQLFDGTDRGARLRELARQARGLGLRSWIWVHELDNVPKPFLQGKAVQMDRPGFGEWLTARYEELFKTYPEFDGVMLTFHETQYKIFDNRQVQSSLGMPERFARMINLIDAVCRRHKKDFIVRSFLYEPEQMQWFKDGYRKTGAHVMVLTKCEPHDWDPYYPHDPLIGAFPDRKQIIEFDGSSEFTGKNRIPYASPGYFEHRWRYDLKQPGVVGYNVRLDHAGYDALYTPNEINIYTLYRLTADPKITGERIWKEWTLLRYGAGAAPKVEAVLRPSFEAVNKAFFPLQFWITDHSRLPKMDYAVGHISSRTMAKWYPDKPEYKVLEEKLQHPDPALVDRIVKEKEEAIALARKSMAALAAARPYMKPEQYEDLRWRVELLERTARIWRLHAEAMFGYLSLAEGRNAPGLVERVRKAIEGLYREAEISARDPRIGNDPPGSAKEIRAVADELKQKMDALK